MKLLSGTSQKQDVTQYKAAFAYLSDEGSMLTAEKLFETLRSFSLNADAISGAGAARQQYTYQQFYTMMMEADSSDTTRLMRRRSFTMMSSSSLILSTKRVVGKMSEAKSLSSAVQQFHDDSGVESASDGSQQDTMDSPRNIAGILENARNWIREDPKFAKGLDAATSSKRVVSKPRSRELWESKREPAAVRRADHSCGFASSSPRLCGYEAPKQTTHVTPRQRKPFEKLTPMERRPRLPDFVRNRDPVVD
jgi:hypothetical protein